MNLEDFELPELSYEPEQIEDFVTGEMRTIEPPEHIETNELQRGDFVLVITPSKLKLRRNAVFGRLEKVEKGYKPIPPDFKEVLLPLVRYGDYQEFIGTIEEKIEDGYSYYKGEFNEDGTILLKPITQLTEK